MRYETKANHCKRLANLIKDAYYWADHACLNHDETQALLDKVRNDPAYPKLPRHVHSFLDGIESVYSAMHQEKLTSYLWYNGRLVPPDDIPSGEWKNVDGEKGNLVYKKNPSKTWYTDEQRKRWKEMEEERKNRVR